jgi:GH25 family lysozyme M1 (1,4-beta-N-acetylmuramidase)
MAYKTHADLSIWNDAGEFDWQAYKDAGHEAVAFRISSGLYVDTFTQREWNRAGEVGLLRKGYHFFYPSVSITSQANTFMNNFPSEPELGAWADVEVGYASSMLVASSEESEEWHLDPGRTMQAGAIPPFWVRWQERLSASAVEASIDPVLREFLELVDQMDLLHPTGVYSSKYYFERYVGHNIAYYNDRPLWTAHWNKYVSSPLMPNSFSEWLYWQVDNRTSFPGIPDPTCDLNRVNGDYPLEPPADCCEELLQRVKRLEQMAHTH